jgi:hypothetical protein
MPPDIIPKKTDKRRHFLRGEKGRFKPIPKNTDNGIPQNVDNHIPTNTESDTCPQNTDKKENLETNNRDKVLDAAGSAPACSKSQASPASNTKKSLKGISGENLDGFIEEKGLEWVKEYLRKSGYDEEEIENLSEKEEFKGETANANKGN